MSEGEKTIILFADVCRCLNQHLRSVIATVLIFFCVGLFYAFSQPISYETYATFKEMKGDQHNSKGMMQNLLRQAGLTNTSQSRNTLKSHFLITQIVERLGLQISVQDQSLWKRWFQRVRENWQTEKNEPLDEKDAFIFRDVYYAGEKRKEWILWFLSSTQFEVRDKESHIYIAKGKVGEKLIIDDVTLTLDQIPKEIKISHPYKMSLNATGLVSEKIKKILEINPSRSDPTVYEFYLPMRNRKQAQAIINQLMSSYRVYLKKEGRELASEQLVYLNDRKEELCNQMEEDLKEHVTYLKTHLRGKGFLNLGQHLELLASRKQKHLDQIISLESDVKRLDSATKNDAQIALSGEIGTLQKEVHDLRKQRDTLDLAFLFQNEQKIKPPYSQLENVLCQSRVKLDQINDMEKKLQLSKEGHPEILAILFPYEWGKLHEIDAQRLKEKVGVKKLAFAFDESLQKVRRKKENLDAQLKKTVFSSDERMLVEHELRVTRLQEAILKERLYYPSQDIAVFQGMDLASARALHTDYLKKRDEVEGKVRQLLFSREHLDQSDFEFISLVEILPDGVSRELTREIGGLVQKKRDRRNLTERDIERIDRKLEKNQNDLKRHIDQTVELLKVQKRLFEEKMTTVKGIILDLLTQEISLVNQQIQDQVDQKRAALKMERELTEERIEEIEEELTTVPDQWLKEQQLHFKSDMNINMLTSMMHLVESKNIEHHLMQVQSKPIDYAYSLVFPKSPRIWLFCAISLLIGSILALMGALTWSFSKGFPLSLKNLKLQGKDVYGKLRFPKRKLEEMDASDLEVLRKIANILSSSDTGNVLTLLKATSFEPVVKLLANEEKKVLLIDLTRIQNSEKGLYAFLREESDKNPISKKAHYDVVQIDRPIPLELLKRNRFKQFIHKQKGHYDVVVIGSSASLESTEGHLLSRLSDAIVLLVQYESQEVLEPYFSLEKTGKKLAFVTH